MNIRKTIIVCTKVSADVYRGLKCCNNVMRQVFNSGNLGFTDARLHLCLDANAGLKSQQM